jgi:hypothetical protein
MTTPKDTIRKALKVLRGDALLRAERAFAGTDLDELYGASGKTRRETLESYRRHDEEINAALLWLQGAPV